MTEEQEQLVIAYKDCFGSENGRKVLADLDRRCLYRGDMFDSCSKRITDFNLGKNSIIRYIHQETEKNLDEIKQETAVHKETLT